MSHTFRSRRRAAVPPRWDTYHPHLELLEARLPLGDAALGAALGASLVGGLAVLDPSSAVQENAKPERRLPNLGGVSIPSVSLPEVDAARGMRVLGDTPFLRGQPTGALDSMPGGTAETTPGVSPWEDAMTSLEDGIPAAAFASLPLHSGGPRPVPHSSRAEAGGTSTPIRDAGMSAAPAESRQGVRGTADPLSEASRTPLLSGGAGAASEQLHDDPLQVANAAVAAAAGRHGADGACSISLVASIPSPQLVGEQITWTATPNTCGDKLVYQFSVGPTDGPHRIVRDYSPDNTFSWVPMQEGIYDVRVTIKGGFDAIETWYAGVTDTVSSRVTGTDAVVTPTANPLVALYSAPPCEEGIVEVNFRPLGSSNWMHTDSKPCTPGRSTNFLVAGMLANWTYEMVHTTSSGTSSSLFFTTGTPPAELVFPAFTVRQPPGPTSDLSQNMILHMAIFGETPRVNLLATDLMGRLEWYYDPVQSGLKNMLGNSLVPGGTVLLQGISYNSQAEGYDVLREIDLAGNTVRETNWEAVNAQLAARGQETTYGFHHEAVRLPDGKTAVLAFVLQTVDIKGTPTNYVGDMLIVLDENFQVTWTWDAFDHLDPQRGPVLGESCGGGCFNPPIDAIDWLHSNAIGWSNADGNLVISIRHQDWVIKIDYSGGAGDGHVVWRLGKDGDFTIDSPDWFPWFSHQHYAHYIDNATVVLYDNGNTRCNQIPFCDSRGQVLSLNEKTMEVTPLLNVDLGSYSAALGSAQKLPHGNFVFTSGFLLDFQGAAFGQSIEVLPDGTQVYALEISTWDYRSLRMSDLYGQPVKPVPLVRPTLPPP